MAHPPASVGAAPRRMLRLLALSAATGEEEGGADAELAAVEASLAVVGIEVRWGHPLRVVDHPERLTDALAGLARYRSVAFTSQRGVTSFATALSRAGLDDKALAGLRLACLSGRTAAALREQLHTMPDLAVEGGGKILAEALLAIGGDVGPVLFPRAADGRDDLPSALSAQGVEVEVVAAYETVVDEGEVARLLDAARAEPPHAVALASPRGAAALLDGGFDPRGVLLGAIGRTTARALADRGLRVDVVAPRPSFAALLSALGEALAHRSRSE